MELSERTHIELKVRSAKKKKKIGEIVTELVFPKK